MAAKIVSRGDPIEPIYLNNLRVAAHGWGVVSGLAVSQKGAGANMSVDIATGEAWINGTKVTKGSTTNAAITAAHASYDRYDLVVINSSGTISVIDGTAAATSYANDYDLEANNAILLAEVYVPATDTTIEDAQITDKQIISFIEQTNVANGIAALDASVRLSTDIGGVPSGVIFPFGGVAAPSGYLLCDGSAISRTTYSALFTAIGVAYGVGDGSTTFNIPNTQGKLPVGIGGSGVVNIGDVGGEQTHALIEAELAAHVHTIPIRTHTAINGDFVEGSTGSVEGSTPPTSSTGSGTAHENMPPYVGTEYIIKT